MNMFGMRSHKLLIRSSLVHSCYAYHPREGISSVTYEVRPTIDGNRGTGDFRILRVKNNNVRRKNQINP